MTQPNQVKHPADESKRERTSLDRVRSSFDRGRPSLDGSIRSVADSGYGSAKPPDSPPHPWEPDSEGEGEVESVHSSESTDSEGLGEDTKSTDSQGLREDTGRILASKLEAVKQAHRSTVESLALLLAVSPTSVYSFGMNPFAESVWVLDDKKVTQDVETKLKQLPFARIQDIHAKVQEHMDKLSSSLWSDSIVELCRALMEDRDLLWAQSMVLESPVDLDLVSCAPCAREDLYLAVLDGLNECTQVLVQVARKRCSILPEFSKARTGMLVNYTKHPLHYMPLVQGLLKPALIPAPDYAHIYAMHAFRRNIDVDTVTLARYMRTSFARDSCERMESPWESQLFVCICGRSFDYQNAYSKHTRACPKIRREVSGNLQKAREIWEEKQKPGYKRLRVATHDEFEGDVVPSQVSEDSEETVNSADEADIFDLDLSIAARRTKRKAGPPLRFRDMLPSAPPSTRRVTRPSGEAVETSTAHLSSPQPESNQPSPSIQQMNTPFHTSKNKFYLFRYYTATPTHDPDGELTPKDFVDMPEVESPLPGKASDDHTLLGLGPYPNRSAFLLGEWFWASKSKTLQDFKGLVDIITSQVFSIDDIRNTPWNQINQALGASYEVSGGAEDVTTLFDDAGWRKEEVVINVPFNSAAVIPGPQKYLVGEFHCRSIIAILHERLSGDESRHFHYEPFQLLWKPNDDQPSQRVYGELYNSQAFIDEHRKLQALPPEPNCDLPRVVVALMFASDETHLTQFGNTTVHPLYLYFGNFSKYLRAKPSRHLCNHVAYFIKLPRDFKDFYRAANGGLPPGDISSHCYREAFHAQWRSILDDEFMDAYEHGTVVKCGFDGQQRRFYPRIFTFSADYNEKVNLCGIRHMSHHPCPRCLIPLKEVENLGMPSDQVWRTKGARVDSHQYRMKIKRAQNFIYEQNSAVKSKNVENQVASQSLVPSLNAFSQRFSSENFNIFGAMVVDCLHEIEGGTWESLYTHLLRILECVGGHLSDELDFRYRQTPTFGCDAIRKFRRNSSQMGYMAMREWEDLLQCAIPAFEGLLPEPHNTEVLDLLYILASWHGFAKLRQHTEATLSHLEKLTEEFGSLLRSFKLKTCAKHDTRELAREVAARNRLRRNQAKRLAEEAQSRDKFPPPLRTPAIIVEDIPSIEKSSDSKSVEAKSIEFNLQTYKLHAMGDYVDSIRRFGTVDSYSTESGELEHRVPKSYYSRTSKKDFIKQMTSIERRQARIRRIREAIGDDQEASMTSEDPYKTNGLRERYIIGKSEKVSFHIGHFLQQNLGDPAVKGFYSDLRAHLLARLHSQSVNKSAGFNELVTDSSFFIQRDRIYCHKTLRVNYTTYDVRRAQDLINPNTAQCNIMVLNDEQDQQGIAAQASSRPLFPFAYARVLAIYHVNLVLTSGNPKPQKFDILWVRWYQQEGNTPKRRLPKLFLPPMQHHSCAFIDPADVVRACHIIPVFAEGRRYTGECRALSALGKDREDWKSYYVSQFADRDLLLRTPRYWGLGVGHIQATDRVIPELLSRHEKGKQRAESEPLNEDFSYDIDGEPDSLEAQIPQPGAAEMGAGWYDSAILEEDPNGEGGLEDEEALDDEQFAQKYSLYEA